MSREEQIIFKAGSIADGCIAHGAPYEDYYQGFIEGAKWADANPFRPSIPDLDESAEEYANKEFPDEPSCGQWGTGDYESPVDMEYPREIAKDSFKAGAQWMAEQLK